MIGEYLRSFDGIQTLGLVFLFVCFGAFLSIVVRAVRADKNFIRKMEQLPLDGEASSPSPSER